MMALAFLTAGNPRRMTGGYLYHARVFDVLRQNGVVIDEIVVAADASPPAQRLAAPVIGRYSERVLDADVVVVDALAALTCQPSIADWQAARPLIAMVHELPSVAGDAIDNDVLAAEERLLAADIVIAVSRHGAEFLTARGVAGDRLRIVSPGCDRISPPPEKDCRSSGRLQALAVAQWIPRKGIDTLVQAWGMLQRDDATLVLIGETNADSVYAARVREQISAAQRAIQVWGAVTDAELAGAYASADVFVLPSRYEGYGMVYAEALLHGLPIVACDTGPVPELLGPDAGLLVPVNDPVALATALDRLLADDALRTRMAAAATRRGQELPIWAECAAGFQAAMIAAMRIRG